MLIASRLRHLLKIADLYIRPKYVGADHQPDIEIGEVAPEPFHTVHRGVGRIADAEDNFVLGIILQAIAAKTLVHFRIGTLQRLKDGNWRKWRYRRRSMPA